MVLDLNQRRRLRQSVYLLLVVGVIVGGAAFFFGDDAITAIGTMTSSPSPTLTSYKVKPFFDANGNREQDALEQSEHLIKNAELTLSRDGQQYAQNTGETGEAFFDELQPGTYQISITLAGAALQVEPQSADVGEGAPPELLAAVTSNSPYSGITGKVVLDRNANGQPDDVGFENRAIELLLNGVTIDSVQSDESGQFTFANVEPGMYDVRVVVDAVEQREYEIVSLPQASVEVLSDLHRPYLILFIRVRGPSAELQGYRLAQASPSAGFLVEKAATDADEKDQEFINVRPGGVLQFSIAIKPFAAQPGTVSNVTVTDVLPSILTPATISHNGSVSNNTITWTLGSLAIDDTVTLTYNAAVNSASATGYYKNTVTVTGDQAEQDDDDVTIVVTAAGIATTTNLPADEGPVVPIGSQRALLNSARSSTGQPAPQTGAPAWVVSGVLTLLMLLIGGILLAGYSRTHRALDESNRPDQS